MTKFGHAKFKLPANSSRKDKEALYNVVLDGRIKPVQEQRSTLTSFPCHGDI